MKTPSQSDASFNNLLRPVLGSLKFEEIKLKDCIRPEFLFRNDRIWFSLSWDWRDQYLDVCLGHLFWFRDVMPRFVVIGDFSYWDSSITWDAIRFDSDFEAVFSRIRDSLPIAVSRLEGEYSNLFDGFKKSRGNNVRIEDYIGEEANIDTLKKYRT